MLQADMADSATDETAVDASGSGNWTGSDQGSVFEADDNVTREAGHQHHDVAKETVGVKTAKLKGQPEVKMDENLYYVEDRSKYHPPGTVAVFVASPKHRKIAEELAATEVIELSHSKIVGTRWAAHNNAEGRQEGWNHQKNEKEERRHHNGKAEARWNHREKEEELEVWNHRETVEEAQWGPDLRAGPPGEPDQPGPPGPPGQSGWGARVKKGGEEEEGTNDSRDDLLADPINQEKPNDYKELALIACLLNCFFGIAALSLAFRSVENWRRGDRRGARRLGIAALFVSLLAIASVAAIAVALCWIYIK